MENPISESMNTVARSTQVSQFHWFLAARPKTLALVLGPILLGSALSFSSLEKFQLWKSVLALLSALCIQIGTNLINDALDFIKGTDTHERLGPKRVSQSGLISPQKVWWGGLFFFGLAILFAVPLVWQAGWPLLVLGVFSLLAGYCYTGGPYPLAYLGLGDLFVLLFFGWAAVLGMVYLHTGSWSADAFLAGTQVGLLCTVPIAINNLRDISTDRKSAKKTLAVRFGSNWAKAEILFCSFIPYLLNTHWWVRERSFAALFPFLALPLSVLLCKKILRVPHEAHTGFDARAVGATLNSLLGLCVFVQLLFSFLLQVGLLLSVQGTR